MTKSVPLFERIRQRCSEEEHRYLDLSASGAVDSDGGQLLELAEQIAAYMAAHLAGFRVVICLDQCSTFLPVFWGCLRAGLTAIPVTLAASGGRASGRELEELQQLLNQASPVAVVVDEASALLQGLLPCNSMAAWIPFSRLVTAAVPPPPVGQSSAEVAFALQTSGTTGECKYAAFSGDFYDFEVSNARRVLTLFPLGSSTGIGYGYALQGLSAYLPLREAVRDPALLLAAIEAYRIEVVVMPPVMVSALVRYFTAASQPLVRRDLSSLVRLNIGSSTIPLEAVDQLDRLLMLWGAPDGVIHFAYGLTETGGVAYGPYRGLAEHQHSNGLRIGSVSPEVLIQIANQQPGEPGPIRVQRSFPFLGYLTSDAFGAWSLTSFKSGVDWFETGDLGLIVGDELILTGREKDTIVLNSRKISLGAIELFVVQSIPDVFETVVACVAPGERLVLFVVPAPEGSVLPLDHLQVALSQQIQRQFGVPLAQLSARDADEIPRTVTGKVRKSDLVESLPDPNLATPDAPAKCEGDASIDQQLLIAIRRQATVFRSADGNQPISAFGIDSLALAQIIGSVERASGRRCRLEACPADPTIHQLAELFSDSAQLYAGSGNCREAYINPDQITADLARFPLRYALAHQIQAANLQMGGEPMGSDRVVRRFNRAAKGVPVVLIGKLSSHFVSSLADELCDHPLYYLRVLHDYASPVNQSYLTCCYLDWLEACLPECRPVMVGFCLAGRLALDLSRQMWYRARAPRLTVLMDWNVGRYSCQDAYKGVALYHVHEHYHGGSSSKRQEIQAGLLKIAPRTLMTYWSARREPSGQGYIDWQATRQILVDILGHEAVRRIVSAA